LLENFAGFCYLSLARLVFPELRDDFATSIWEEPNVYGFIPALLKRIFRQNNKSKVDGHTLFKKDYKINSYNLDLIQETKVGYFVVKDFENTVVRREDIEKLLTVCNRLRKTPAKSIFRIICVAKNYDENFLKRESLEKLMINDIQSGLETDLLIKELNGYSVLWVS
jgi:hypothetical protein